MMETTIKFLPQPPQIPADSARFYPCRALQSAMSLSIPNSSFLIPHCNYTFSAKERVSETGLSYFGSRYYSSDLSIWLSVDPMAGKYPHQSNYVYCSNNPIRIIDPNGEDEYFNEFGLYLGTDNSKTNNIRMITQNDWNLFKNTDAGNNEIIDPTFGNILGSLLSESDATIFSDEAILGVFQYYGFTESFDIKTVRDATSYQKSFGIGTNEFNMAYDNESGNVFIPITEIRKKRLYDNFYNIRNCFSHEKGHQLDKQTPLTHKREREINAIIHQISSPSWHFTTLEYKQQVYKNLRHWNSIKQ